MIVSRSFIVLFVILINGCDLSSCQALLGTRDCLSGIQERTGEMKDKILGYTWEDIKNLREENAKLKQTTSVQNRSIELIQQSVEDMQRLNQNMNLTLNRIMSTNQQTVQQLKSEQRQTLQNVTENISREINSLRGSVEENSKNILYLGANLTETNQNVQDIRTELRNQVVQTDIQNLTFSRRLSSNQQTMQQMRSDLKQSLDGVTANVSRDLYGLRDTIQENNNNILFLKGNLSETKQNVQAIRTEFQTRAASQSEFQEITEDIEGLKRELVPIRGSIQSISASFSNTGAMVLSLNSSTRNIELNVGQIQTEMRGLNHSFQEGQRQFVTSMSALNETTKVLKRDIADLKGSRGSTESLGTSVQSNSQAIQRIDSTIQAIRQRYAFTVRLGNGTDLQAGETIPFAEVLNNIGNMYNIADYTFRAPVPGLYYFHLAICSQRGRRATARVVKGSISLGFVYAEDQDNYDCGGNGVVAELSTGDAVKAISAQNSEFDPNSFFTGMLMKS